MRAVRLKLWYLALPLAGTICLLGRPGATASADPVPTTHWAYDATAALAQGGVFTGFPDGTFQGKRPVSRADFAVAIRTMLGDSMRRAGEGEGRWYVRASAGPGNIRALIREFAPELAQQGVKPREAAAAADRFEERWRDPSPHGISAPMPGVSLWDSANVWPEDPALQEAGAAAARRELSVGDPSLWYLVKDRTLPNPPGALPLRPAAGASPREQIQQLIGHNREVWNALSEKHSPYRRRWNWLMDAVDPAGAWKRGKSSSFVNGELTVGAGHTVTLSGINCVGPFWDVRLDGRDMDNPLAHSGHLRVVPCASGSEVAIFSPGRGAKRLYVIELRTGCVLNVWPER